MPTIKGVRDLRQIQICKQTNCATPGTVTARLVGKCGIELDVGRVMPDEATGVMSKHIVDRHYDRYTLGQGPVTPGDEGATYEQICWYLGAAAIGGVTGGVAGPELEQTWVYTPDLAAAVAMDAPDYLHIVYGDNAAQWEGTCCFARQLVISGAFQGIWQLEADMVCRNWDNTGVHFEVIPYPPVLTTILGQQTAFYLDTTCLFAGAPTVRTESLIDWKLTIPGFHPKFFQDGVLHYSTSGLASRALLFDWTMEFDSDLAKAIVWEAFATGAPLYVRLLNTGPLLGATVHYSVQIDLCLQPIKATTLDERDGNDIIKFTAETVYDVACVAVPEWEMTVVNLLPVLTACGA